MFSYLINMKEMWNLSSLKFYLLNLFMCASVSHCCYNKLLQIWWLKIIQIYYLSVLEIKSLKWVSRLGPKVLAALHSFLGSIPLPFPGAGFLVPSHFPLPKAVIVSCWWWWWRLSDSYITSPCITLMLFCSVFHI